MPPQVLLKGCAEELASGDRLVESESCLGALGAAARFPHPRDCSAALGRGAGSAAASERASEGGRRARPGPSCPYDRAGRRRALPFHGKRRPRGGGAPAGLGREREARCGASEPIALARRPPTLPAATTGSGVLPIFACRLPGVPGALGLGPVTPCSGSWGCGTSPERGGCSPHCSEARTEPPAGGREGFTATGRGSVPAPCQPLPFSHL